MPRVTPTARTPDWRFSLERGRTSCTAIGSRRIHTRYSFATPFVDPSRGRNPVYPSFLVNPLPPTSFSFDTPCERPMKLTPLTGRLYNAFHRRRFYLSHRIFLNKYFFNKRRGRAGAIVSAVTATPFCTCFCVREKIEFPRSFRCQLFYSSQYICHIYLVP